MTLPRNDPRDPGRDPVLLRLLPALVHRWNNGLTTVGSVLALGAEATEEEGRMADDALESMRRSLRVLAQLALEPGSEAGRTLDLGTWIRDLSHLLAAVAETRRVRLEVHLPAAPLRVRLDHRFERRLVDEIAGRLLALAPSAARAGLRLVARSTPRAVFLDVLLGGAAGPPGEFADLPSHPGVRTRARRLGDAWGLRVAFPHPAGAAMEPCVPVRRHRPRVLVLEREVSPEIQELLAQHGYRPQGARELPDGATCDLILIDEEWSRASVNWRTRLDALPRLRNVPRLCIGRCAGGQDLPAVRRPAPPQALLSEIARLLHA